MRVGVLGSGMVAVALGESSSVIWLAIYRSLGQGEFTSQSSRHAENEQRWRRVALVATPELGR